MQYPCSIPGLVMKETYTMGGTKHTQNRVNPAIGLHLCQVILQEVCNHPLKSKGPSADANGPPISIIKTYSACWATL
jgi:hypothetical protein